MQGWPYGRQFPRNARPYPRQYGRRRPRRPRPRGRLPRRSRYWEQQEWLLQQAAARRARMLQVAALSLGILVVVGVVVGTVVGLAARDNDDATTTTAAATGPTSTTSSPSGCGQPTISNGNIVVNGDTATYSCNMCYGLLGSDTRTCQNGAWNGTTPRCIGCGCPEIDPNLSIGAKRRRKKRQSKIIGGGPAVENSWPWQVGLKEGVGQATSCGGSLVSEQWIVTAAHCFFGVDNQRINDLNVASLGDHNPTLTGAREQEVSFSPGSVFIHPDYNPEAQDYDIALIKIPTVGLRRDAIWPICLPTSRTFALGEDAWTTGWGALQDADSSAYPTVLQQVKVDIIPRTQCMSATYNYGAAITNNMICAGTAAGGKDACPGDSGGPLVVERDNTWYLAGVTSWGDGCGRAVSPGVYASVSQLEEWLQTTIANN